MKIKLNEELQYIDESQKESRREHIVSILGQVDHCRLRRLNMLCVDKANPWEPIRDEIKIPTNIIIW